MNPFDKKTGRHIIEAIRQAECRTSGEIRVHVKPVCGEEPMQEARKIFKRLRMHRTKERNGVLIFVAWKSRKFAILGDEGIHTKVGDSFWNKTRDGMAAYFSKNDMVGGVQAGVRSVGERLKTYFPAKTGGRNELSDKLSEGS